MQDRHVVHQCKCCLEDINFIEYIMPCKSLICGDCCQKYLIAQIDLIDFHIDKDIKCPNESCKKLHNVHQFRQHILGGKQYNIPGQLELDDKLLIRHLQNDSQVRNCPNIKCKYFGLLPQNIKECKNATLQCELCNTEWQDKIMQQNNHTFLQKVQKIIFQKNEFFSEVYKVFTTKRCPKCKIPITRHGGCYHMICRKCNFEYCWYCCQPYYTHSLFKCASSIILDHSVILISAILIIYFTGVYKYIWNLFLSIIYFMINACIQNLLIFSLILFASFLIEVWKIRREIYQKGYDKQLVDKKTKNFHLSIITGALFFVYLIIILKYKYTITDIFKFAILEFIIFFSIYVGYNSMCFIWYTWMRYIF